MMQIGEKYHENLTSEKVDELLNDYKNKGEQVSHWSKEKIKA